MKPKERKKAIELILKHGYTQKEAAQKVGVQGKTVGVWMKPYKEKIKFRNENIELLEKRLNAMLKDPYASKKDTDDFIFLMKELIYALHNYTLQYFDK